MQNKLVRSKDRTITPMPTSQGSFASTTANLHFNNHSLIRGFTKGFKGLVH